MGNKKLEIKEVLGLEKGTEYVVYNPLTKVYRIEKASDKDIAHNKYRYPKLEFYTIEYYINKGE